MAMPGFSGSCGGIGNNYKPIILDQISPEFLKGYLSLNISYFVNNICNLKCSHCYVGYDKTEQALTIDEWKTVFDELIDLGALTFGNVGKEPTLSWKKTTALFRYFKDKKSEEPTLRFGLVTNAILLDEEKVRELNEINPDYIDISIDGNESVHDSIRGNGAYSQTMTNLKLFPQELRDKVFISLTINRLNLHTIPYMIGEVYNAGIKKILISPYVSTHVEGRVCDDPLYVSDRDITGEIARLLDGDMINFCRYHDLNIYVRTEYATSLGLMKNFIDRKIIDLADLNIDEYGAIFTKHIINTNNIYFNYLPWDNSLKQAIRISHDGYVSNCYDMFFKDYQSRAAGNVREKSVGRILEGHRLAQPEYTTDDQLIELEHTAETSSYHHRIKNAPAMQIQLEG